PTRLEGPLDADAPPLDFDATLDGLLRSSPEIRAAEAEVGRDRVTVRRERVEPIPNIVTQVETGYNFEVQSYTTTYLIGGFLPLFNKNQGTVFQAQSDLARSSANVRRVALSLQNRLADAFARYDTARANAQIFRDETLPRARRAY